MNPDSNLDEVRTIVHVNSAALIVLPPGVLKPKFTSNFVLHKLWHINFLSYFITITPCFVAALQSMLSTPVPARPINLSFAPALIIRSVTFVADRTMIAS